MTLSIGSPPPTIRGRAKTQAGSALSYTPFTVTNLDTSTTASIYSDPVFATSISSPTTDADGIYQFYIAPGLYRLSFTTTERVAQPEDFRVYGYVSPAAAGSGAPTDATYLVATANPSLSAEIPVGATPGGELGGTWASPTIDAIHSGSAHTDFIAKSFYDPITHGSMGSTETFDATIGNYHYGTLDANCTLTLTAGATGGLWELVLELLQDTTGSHTITWPASVKWSGGTAPILTTTASRRDFITLWTRDGGTTWWGTSGPMNLV